ncbi:MAG TPA: N-acetyltransferase, partial [Bradyrhizobium sp.]|nr:N-acetyltransferase [Bradyrhizobium sp.]
GRFGFSALKTRELSLPGAFERERLLALELRQGALAGASGMIVPTGKTAATGKRAGTARNRKLAPRAA